MFYFVCHIFGAGTRERTSDIRVQRHISVAMQGIDIKLQQLFEQQQILNQHYDSGNRKQNKQCIIPLPELEVPTFDGYNQLESHLRSLEALRQDINHEIFALLITSKLQKEILMQLIIQRGARKKWSVAIVRQLLKSYICAAEEVEQLSDPGNVQSETELAESLQELPYQRFSQSKRQTVHQGLFKR